MASEGMTLCMLHHVERRGAAAGVCEVEEGRGANFGEQPMGRKLVWGRVLLGVDWTCVVESVQGDRTCVWLYPCTCVCLEGGRKLVCVCEGRNEGEEGSREGV